MHEIVLYKKNYIPAIYYTLDGIYRELNNYVDSDLSCHRHYVEQNVKTDLTTDLTNVIIQILKLINNTNWSMKSKRLFFTSVQIVRKLLNRRNCRKCKVWVSCFVH